MHKYLIIPLIIGMLFVTSVRAGTEAEQLSLDAAIQTALNHNAAIKEARFLEQSAQEGLKSSFADFLPKASANYSFTCLEDAPFQRLGGVERTVGDTDNYHWDVTLTQPLFTGFRLWSKYGMAEDDVEIGRIVREKAVQDVVRDVKTAYYEALLAGRMEKVAGDRMKALEAQEKDAQSFYSHGIIPKNDLLKSRIARAAAVQDLEKSRADSRISRNRLAMVLGISQGPDPEPIDVNAPMIEVGRIEALTAEALKKRPELCMMNQVFNKYGKTLRLAQSAWYPDVSLIGRYERNGDNPGATENDYTNDHNSSVSIQAKWTFFEWGKTRSDTAKIRYDRIAYKEKIRAMEDRVRLEVKQEFLNLGVREKNITTAEEALDQARENFRITKSQYLQHVTTSTEVLDAQTYLSTAETDYYKALYGYKITLARLEWAVGRNVIRDMHP